jgi:hypothetical protein
MSWLNSSTPQAASKGQAASEWRLKGVEMNRQGRDNRHLTLADAILRAPFQTLTLAGMHAIDSSPVSWCEARGGNKETVKIGLRK